LVYFGVERGGVEAFVGHGELIDKRELKITQAFDRGIASGFVDRRTTRNDKRGSAEDGVSNYKILRSVPVHEAGALGYRS